MGYLGLIEIAFTIVGLGAFYIWQKRSLVRDIADREARERGEKMDPPDEPGRKV
ncbi:MAG: hypothetical protein AAF737_00645 [Pseudomonadota bacterium]